MGRIIRPSNPGAARRLVRDQHIISRFYLNKFADSEKRVLVYAAGQPPRRKSTKGQAWERDYFEYTVNGESTQNQYENWFSRIETDAAAIYDTIHAGKGLNGAGEVALAIFVASMFLRSRKVREQIGPELTRMVEAEFDCDEQIREMQCELLAHGIFVHSDELRAKVQQTLAEMRAPAFGHLAGIEENVRIIATNILEKGRWFVLEAAPGCEFVTSDCPVQTWALNGPKAPLTLGSGFRHQNTAVVFPLSPKALFFAGPNEIVWNSNVLSPEDTAKVNMATVQFAHRAVYALSGSVELQELVDRELNKYTFGKNCFIPAKGQAELAGL